MISVFFSFFLLYVGNKPFKKSEFLLKFIQNTGPKQLRWQAPCQLFAIRFKAIEVLKPKIELTIIAETLKGRLSLKTI